MLESLPAVLTAASPFILALMAGLGYLVRSQREHLKELEIALNNEKRDVYLIFVTAFYEFMLPNVNDDGTREVADERRAFKLAQDLKPFNKKIFVYGSDEVIRKYVDFYQTVVNGAGPDGMFSAVGELLIAIRKDMGWKKTNLTPKDFIRMIVNDYDKQSEPGGLLESFDKRYS
jgi:hypothetical protein